MAKMKSAPSSATIRNEMSDLTEMGLLEQPHTSAGRIPTRRGYRLYVDSLMEEYRLSFEETLLLHSLMSESGKEPERILSDMTDLIAKMTGYAAVAFAKERTGTIERFDGVYVNPHSFLMVMVTSSGKAISKQLQLPIPLDRERVDFIVHVLNEHLAKKELGSVTLERMAAIEKELGDYRSLIGPLIRIVYDVMAMAGEVSVVVKGVANLFAFPEFSAEGKGEKILRELEDESLLLERFYQEGQGSLRVRIGSDGEGLDEASFVMCPFRWGKSLEVTCCIIGPKRMDYARAMARLEYLSRKIHAAVGDIGHLPLIETKES